MTMQEARPSGPRGVSRANARRDATTGAVERNVGAPVPCGRSLAVVRRIEWASPVPGLWVASVATRLGAEYAGTVEKTTAGYELRNGRGAVIGVFVGADEARRALVRHMG